VEPTLDNAMIFGGIGNLRLAPHVREGRPVGAVESVRGAERTSGAESSLPAGRPRGFQSGEKVTISAVAQAAFEENPAVSSAGAPGEASAPNKLTDEEQREVQELKARDAEVRAHEQAHKAAGAGLSMSGPTYEYTQGPDGRRYAAGGEVGIDVSEVSGDPEATARKAQQIRAAALAPAEPSSQDRAVAAQAAAMAAGAQAEIAEQRRQEMQDGSPNAGVSGAATDPSAGDALPGSNGIVPSSVASAYAAASGSTPTPATGAIRQAPTNGLFA